MRILIDSDVFVDHLRGHRRLVIGSDEVHYSVVTRAELFAGRGTQERRVQRLLEPYNELLINRGIAARAGKLRRVTDIRLPDALIAATALEHQLYLLTRNTRDFGRVRGLRLA